MTGSSFTHRHIGPDDSELGQILSLIGADSLDDLARQVVPAGILDGPQDNGLEALPPAASEHEVLAELAALAAENTVATSMIGLGYYDTLTPPVLVRNILENPAWYTAYTPYQPEISQGRLEALLNFQTMVSDLTGMEVANASMLDESTAAAEAMTLLRRAGKSKSPRFVVDSDVFPQTAAVIATRAEPLGIEIVTTDLAQGLPDGDFFGVLLQTPAASGRVIDCTPLIEAAHERGALVAVGADLLALTLIAAPGELGATCVSGPPNASGCPWASVDPTPATWQSTPSKPGNCRVASSVSRRTQTATSPTGCRCRPVSSTSGERRRPATSAPRRCFSRSSPRCTPATTGPTGSAPSRAGCTGMPAHLRRRCGPVVSRWCMTTSSTPC